MAQMEEQNKTPEKEQNELEIQNLSDARFKTLVIRIIDSIKKTQAEMKVTLSEIKKNLQRTNMKLNQINDLEHKEEESTQLEQQEEKRIFLKNEDKLRSLWDIFKCTNIWIIGVSEGEEEEQEIENLFEKIMKENFPNLVNEIDIQVQEAQSPKQEKPK